MRVISKLTWLILTLARARVNLGGIKMAHEWDFAGGEAEFKKALQLDPNDIYEMCSQPCVFLRHGHRLPYNNFMESKPAWRSLLSEGWIPFAALWLWIVLHLPKELQLPFFFLLLASILLYRDFVTRGFRKTAAKQ